MAPPTNIKLRVVKTDYIYCGANFVLQHCDIAVKSIGMKRKNSDVAQSDFADGEFGLTSCRRISVTFVEGQGGS